MAETVIDSPERLEQMDAFLNWWRYGEAVGEAGRSWYDVAVAAWLAACDWSDERHRREDAGMAFERDV